MRLIKNKSFREFSALERLMIDFYMEKEPNYDNDGLDPSKSISKEERR